MSRPEHTSEVNEPGNSSPSPDTGRKLFASAYTEKRADKPGRPEANQAQEQTPSPKPTASSFLPLIRLAVYEQNKKSEKSIQIFDSGEKGHEKPIKVAVLMEPRAIVNDDGQPTSTNGVTLTADAPQLGSFQLRSDVTSQIDQNNVFTADSTAIDWTTRKGITVGGTYDSNAGFGGHLGVPMGRQGNAIADLNIGERFVGAGVKLTIPSWSPFNKK